jgi:hypothetical protein
MAPGKPVSQELKSARGRCEESRRVMKDRVFTMRQKMADFCGFYEPLKDAEGSYANARQAREELHTAGVLMHITFQHPSEDLWLQENQLTTILDA